MLRRNGPVVKSVESVLRLEGSLWGERFVEEVGLEPGVTLSLTHTVCEIYRHFRLQMKRNKYKRHPRSSITASLVAVDRCKYFAVTATEKWLRFR